MNTARPSPPPREAAAAGGITTIAALPDSSPPSTTRPWCACIRSRGEETGTVTLLPYGAATRGCRGEELAEFGLLKAAGAVAFTDGTRAIASSRLMRRALSYASGFGARIVQHPEDPELAAGGAATEGARATRLGLPGIPAAAEAIWWRATSAWPNSPAARCISPMSPRPRRWP